MPKQNRPLVRDGRIQTKKRTDRSYLRTSAAPQPSEEPVAEEPAGEPDEVAEVIAKATQSLPPSRLPAAARAMQQQGARRRREFDLEALAISDTRYAIHELRRIAILATMVVVTLVVLGFVLR